MKTTFLRDKMLLRGGTLARFLNDAPERAEKERVLQLRECCLRLQQGLTKVIRAGEHVVRSSSSFWCGWAADKDIRALLRETNQLLARYSYRYAMPPFLPLTTGDYVTVAAELQPVKVKRERGLPTGKAIELLLSLAEWGALQRLLQCPNCRKWFMAGRTDQRFCSAVCNTKHHNQNKDLKKYAAYMRKYRKVKKEQQQSQEKAWLKRGERHAKN